MGDIHSAVVRGDVDAVKRLVEQGEPLDAKDGVRINTDYRAI